MDVVDGDGCVEREREKTVWMWVVCHTKKGKSTVKLPSKQANKPANPHLLEKQTNLHLFGGGAKVSYRKFLHQIVPVVKLHNVRPLIMI